MIAVGSFDAAALAHAQLTRDAIATRRFPSLFEHKRRRMIGSAHGLLRGSTALFYDLVDGVLPALPGRTTVGWMVGDMHVENLGIYRSEDGHTVFDIDDFDEATHGPLALDLLRATTSMLLAADDLGGEPVTQIHCASALLASYRERIARDDDRPDPLAPRFDDAVQRVAARRQRTLLRERVERVDGHWRYIRHPRRYLELPPDLREAAPRLLERYFDALGDRAPEHPARTHLEDVAQRVAGTGNLGYLRLAFVLRRHDRVRLVELKECHASAVHRARALPATSEPDALRVVGAANLLPHRPARRLAAVIDDDGRRSFVGRRLTPQQNKFDADTLQRGHLPVFARLLGARIAAAHLRAAPQRDAVLGWHVDDDAMLDASIAVASVHRAVHLAYARFAPGFDAERARADGS